MVIPGVPKEAVVPEVARVLAHSVSVVERWDTFRGNAQVEESVVVEEGMEVTLEAEVAGVDRALVIPVAKRVTSLGNVRRPEVEDMEPVGVAVMVLPGVAMARHTVEVMVAVPQIMTLEHLMAQLVKGEVLTPPEVLMTTVCHMGVRVLVEVQVVTQDGKVINCEKVAAV